MQPKVDRITLLVQKYLRNELNVEEHNDLQQWLSESEQNTNFLNEFKDVDKTIQELQTFHNIDTNKMWKRTMELMNKKK